MSEAEEVLALQIKVAGLPEPVREYRFWPKRRYRFDFAWPGYRIDDRPVAVEVEGGIYVKGRHTRPSGYENDCRKYSHASILGWVLIRVTPSMIDSGEALEMLQEALDGAECKH